MNQKTQQRAAMLIGALAPVSADVPMPDWNRKVLSFELFPPDASSDFWYSTATVGLVAYIPQAEDADASFLLRYYVDGVQVGERTYNRFFGGAGNCDCAT